jgi:hypothetical protein
MIKLEDFSIHGCGLQTLSVLRFDEGEVGLRIDHHKKSHSRDADFFALRASEAHSQFSFSEIVNLDPATTEQSTPTTVAMKCEFGSWKHRSAIVQWY